MYTRAVSTVECWCWSDVTYEQKRTKVLLRLILKKTKQNRYTNIYNHLGLLSFLCFYSCHSTSKPQCSMLLTVFLYLHICLPAQCFKQTTFPFNKHIFLNKKKSLSQNSYFHLISVPRSTWEKNPPNIWKKKPKIFSWHCSI